MGKTMTKLICGIGINDADYAVYPNINGTRTMCPIYRAWSGMITRCYSSNSKKAKPTYIGCSVDKDWHKFSSFRIWALKQDWLGKSLDKDILFQGNLVYSEKTCVFVDKELNVLLTCMKSSKGDCPVGVWRNKGVKKYQASIARDGEAVHLGLFSDKLKAHAAWQKTKADYIEKVAKVQTDERIKNALMLRVYQLRDDLANGRETVKL